MEKGQLTFVNYSKEFLDLSWIWLNDPEIKLLTATPNITKEDQLKWYQTLNKRNDYKIWGVQYENNKIGVVGLKNITAKNAEYFGYIGEKIYWGKGLGRQLLDYSILVSQELQLTEVWLKVINNNERAIRAYEKFGFQKFREEDFFIFMNFKLHESKEI